MFHHIPNFTKKYTCLLFGEAERDYKILQKLSDLDKLHHHTQAWNCTCACHYGESPDGILGQCLNIAIHDEYDLAICLIDLDGLIKIVQEQSASRHQATRQLLVQQKEMEERAHQYHGVIVWQKNNAEDEYRRVLQTSAITGKHRLNMLARQYPEKFINSKLWCQIITAIQNRQKELESA